MSATAMSHDRNKAPTQRPLRVAEEIRHVLASIFERGELRDPRLAHVLLTVTEVRMSPDLRQATVFVLPLVGGPVAEALAALARAKGFLRGRVAALVRLRYAPDLTFRFDPSFDEAARIDRLLHQPDVARDLGASNERDQDGDDSGA